MLRLRSDRRPLKWLRPMAGMSLLALLVASMTVLAADTVKRPLTHADYDSWQTISSQTLSRDGRFLAYFVMPAEGDGELVVRNLATGKEWRHSKGGRQSTAPAAPGAPPEIAAAAARGGRPLFTADGRYLVFNSAPTKSELAEAKAAKKKADEMPRPGMAVMNLATGKVTVTPRVRSFQVPEDGSSWIAYSMEPKTEPGAGQRAQTPEPAQAPPAGARGQGRRGGGAGGRGGAGAAAQPSQPRPQVGSDLVVRNLADGKQRVLSEVNDYTFSKDGKLLIYSTISKTDAANGLFAVTPGASAPALPLLRGKGKFTKMTWDEKQTQLVFMSDRDTATAKQPTWKVYYWGRKPNDEIVRLAQLQVALPLAFSTAFNGLAMVLPLLQAPLVDSATELIGADLPNCTPGLVMTDRGALTFSQDGSKVFFGLARPTPPAPEQPKAAEGSTATSAAPATPAEERVTLDLWHWKDDFIQPMQKLRVGQERGRTLRAVMHLKDRKLVQLADENLRDVNPVGEGDWAVGIDDRPYRILVGQDTNYSDQYLVNTWDGTRKPLLKKHQGSLLFSPSAKNAIYFDGTHWHAIALPDGKSVNLTHNLGVAFFNEDTDTPSQLPAYGATPWTVDEKQVVLTDRYDQWLVNVDGSGAKCLTAGLGRQLKTSLRLVRLDPLEKTLDLNKPILLRAEEEATRSTGFYRILPGAAPEKLLTGRCDYTTPIKAKNADVYVLTSMTFYDYPDLLVTNAEFKDLKKVSSVGAQRDKFNWGKAELITYKNADGVKLTGTLIKPENFDPKKKYPMMVYIYERLSQNVHRFVAPAPGTSINTAYYVSNGYLILEPDIVYTIGYPGQSALKCVLPAIQAVVDQGIVDEKAIGIQGHSWGGYQIAYMITQTNRFRAVEAGAPVANMTSAYSGIRWGTGLPRQFQYEHTQSRIGGTLWQYPMRFIENSPVFMADRVQTPIMILHNDQDDAVPWYQGIEYYLALRRLGKEVYLFNYNGELHGLRRRPNQKDYTVRMQQFFDHYLKGAARPTWMEKGEPYIEKDNGRPTLQRAEASTVTEGS